MVIFGVLSSNSFDITAMQMYIDPASVVITFGGSICSTIGCFKLADGINGFKSISLPFKDKTYDPSQTIRTIIDMSNVGRKEGLLALEEAANGIEDAWGMIGTLLGLIAMLNKLSDPSAIGPQMSVALVTTLYGSLIANWLCAPIAGKLSVNNDMEVVNRQITIEGLLSIQAGENPRVIEEKLKSFLSPSVREGVLENGRGGEE